MKDSLLKNQQEPKTFGTFGGIYPTLHNSSGIMYLRLGWVVGNAGLLGSMDYHYYFLPDYPDHGTYPCHPSQRISGLEQVEPMPSYLNRLAWR